jgi:hypothetical protein
LAAPARPRGCASGRPRASPSPRGPLTGRCPPLAPPAPPARVPGTGRTARLTQTPSEHMRNDC